ncbi:MAG: hypothetical protein KAS67_07920, partial [Thermoplasmata archaeon]|nr:hypothetical protein [Thermoplasmata archaeon]
GDIMHDAAFNSGSGQYYAVGEDGEGYGTMYTWPAVGAPDPDTWTLPMETGALKTIGFSSLGNYAIIGGAPHPHGNIFHYNGTAFYNLTYTDDTIEDFSFAPGFTWGVAVGWNLAMEGAYFYHYAPTKMIDMSFKLPSGTQQLYGVAAKGATSPMSALAAGSGSVLAGFPMASNSDTALKVNTDVPHGYTVDMWDMADWTGVPGASKLDQDVDILETYTFRGEFNYTVGGVNKFFDGTNNVRVNLTAWYDNGAQFSASTPVVGANEDDRTRQFSAVWEDGVAGDSAALTYAAGGPTNEFTLASSGYNVSGKLDDHYFIYFNITFEKQTWASTGAFSGDGGFDYYNPDIRLDDINSWDFRFEIYDAGFLTANNYTYGEFGVFTSSIVTVVGDPAANAPPGTFGAALFPYSNITYSCNRDYYVNVSIEDLADLTATNFITANWVDLQHVNINGQALAANTDILAVTPIVAAGTEVGIWGNWGATQMLPTPRNGTTANGPLGSDFWLPLNNQATQVRWWIDVPAGTAEGLYEGAITVTIGYYP